MTGYLAEYAIALADLAEAEGRALRRGLAMVGWAWGFIAVASVLLIAAVVLWLWAIYMGLAALVPPALAAALTGTLAFLIAGIPGWLAVRTIR